MQELKKLQKNLALHTDPMTQKIRIFLDDIIGDIQEGREINIDSIEQDEYIENFLASEELTLQYNSLLKSQHICELKMLLRIVICSLFILFRKKSKRILWKLLEK